MSASKSVAAEAFRRIAESWELTEDESAGLLGSDVPTMRALLDCQSELAFSEDLQYRIATIVAIWEDLAAIFGTNELARGWVKRLNSDFGNQPPIRLMTSASPAGLMKIRGYLDTARQAS